MLDIKGYEGYYKISKDGFVFSCRANKFLKGFSKNGEADNYKRIELQLFGNKKKFQVHRLVADAFIPNIDNKPFVNHKNGNKSDNHVSNLEWCTQEENQLHAYKKGLQNPNNGVKFSNNTSGYAGVTKSGKRWKAQIRHNGELFYLGLYDNKEDASRVYQRRLSFILDKIQQ